MKEFKEAMMEFMTILNERLDQERYEKHNVWKHVRTISLEKRTKQCKILFRRIQ